MKKMRSRSQSFRVPFRWGSSVLSRKGQAKGLTLKVAGVTITCAYELHAQVSYISSVAAAVLLIASMNHPGDGNYNVVVTYISRCTTYLSYHAIPPIAYRSDRAQRGTGKPR